MLQSLRNRLQARRTRRVYRDFLASGNLPWTPGYEQHKVDVIATAVNQASWDHRRLPQGHGWRLDERVVEYPWFMSRLPAGSLRLLDAGSTLNQPYILGHPKLREKTVFISTLAPEHWAAWQWGVSYVYEDLRQSCFRNDHFDAIACISTLEHVGLDNAMLYTSDSSKREHDGAGYRGFVSELRRMLKPGGTLYLSMPFGTHINHGWFQIFDAGMVDDVIALFAPSQVEETIYRYLADGWTVSNREEARDATYFDIHKTKTYDADHAAASRAVVCLELTK